MSTLTCHENDAFGVQLPIGSLNFSYIVFLVPDKAQSSSCLIKKLSKRICCSFQLKRKKFSEVMTQINLPFEKSNIEMDLENDVREAFQCDVDNFDDVTADVDSATSVDPSTAATDVDKLVVGSDIEALYENNDDEDVAILKKLISMTSDLVNDSVDGNDVNDVNDVEDQIPTAIPQVDGSEDLDPPHPPPNKIPKLEIDPDGTSPRKDFSIAGLLHHPQQHDQSAAGPSRAPSVAPGTSSLPRGQPELPTIPTMGGLGLPPRPATASGSVPSQHQLITFQGAVPAPSQPSVFIQHLSTPELATSFAESFQQTTGRTLQYVTSVRSFQDLTPFPTVHLNPPALFQSISTPFQSYLTPQFGYIPQQPFIVSPQTGFLASGSQLLYNPASYASYPSGSATPGPTQFLAPQAPPAAPVSRLYTHHQPQPQSNNVMLQSQFPGVTRLPQAQKKVARVQPQPWIKSSEQAAREGPSSSATSGSAQPGQRRLDPIKALSNMASHPMMARPDSNPSRLSITHGSDLQSRERNRQSLSDASGGTSNDEVVFLSQTPKPSPDFSPSLKRSRSEIDKQRSVGTQAKLGGPLKIMTPRPWKGIDDSEPNRRIPLPLGSGNLSSGVSVQSSANSSLAGSRPSSNFSSAECPKPPSPEITEMASSTVLSGGIKLTKQKTASASNSIKIVMQHDAESNAFKIQEMFIKEPSTARPSDVDPQAAIQALKVSQLLGALLSDRYLSLLTNLP